MNGANDLVIIGGGNVGAIINYIVYALILIGGTCAILSGND